MISAILSGWPKLCLKCSLSKFAGFRLSECTFVGHQGRSLVWPMFSSFFVCFLCDNHAAWPSGPDSSTVRDFALLNSKCSLYWYFYQRTGSFCVGDRKKIHCREEKNMEKSSLVVSASHWPTRYWQWGIYVILSKTVINCIKHAHNPALTLKHTDLSVEWDMIFNGYIYFLKFLNFRLSNYTKYQVYSYYLLV